MIRRLRLDLGGPAAAPVRLLAVSDERVATLDDERNRARLGALDAVVGCGDLDPDYLCFLADAFRVPLLYVRGNHDRGAAWAADAHSLPRPLDGRLERMAGLGLIGLSWPGPTQGRARREELSAWTQALAAAVRAGRRGSRPLVVLSHAPPTGLGDLPADPFHRGFAAYRWLCRLLKPRLWLHGHTTQAATDDWRTTLGPTELVNVTGAVLIELAAEEAISTTTADDDGHHASRAAATIAAEQPAAVPHSASEPVSGDPVGTAASSSRRTS